MEQLRLRGLQLHATYTEPPPPTPATGGRSPELEAALRAEFPHAVGPDGCVDYEILTDSEREDYDAVFNALTPD